MNQNMKMLPGENRKITKWNNGNGGDRMFTGRNDELRYDPSVKPVRANVSAKSRNYSKKKSKNARFTRILALVDLFALVILIAVLVVNSMKTNALDLEMTEAAKQNDVLVDQCERLEHELEAYKNYDVIASRAADHGFMDDNRLARVQLAIAGYSTETASR